MDKPPPAGEMMKPITMKEIAEKCGVSQPTVSRVLNNKTSLVTQEKRELVLETARQLNYRPNYFAKSLKEGATRCLGVMGSLSIPNFSFNYFSDVVAAIENSAPLKETKYSLLIFGAFDGDQHEQTVELVRKGMVDGLILIILSIDLAPFEEKLLPVLRQAQIPFVAVHSLSRELPYNNVGVDSPLGGYLAARHLYGLGHKQIHYYLRETSPQGLEILEGFKKAMADFGLPFGESHIIRHRELKGDFYEQAYDLARELQDIPRALFVDSDDTAYGFIKGLKERGIAVPRDTAVVGFNDEKPAAYFETDLTTIHHPVRAKGEAAVRMLLDILNGKLAGDQVHRTILKPHLVVRKTCGSGNIPEVQNPKS